MKAFSTIVSGNETRAKEICRVMTSEKFPANYIVLKKGDRGGHWYIVLKGKVQVKLINTANGGSTAKSQEVGLSSFLSSSSDSSLQQAGEHVLLTKGDSFGDMTLKTNPRYWYHYILIFAGS
jgi:CRP-like cAMP-binding protein